MRKAAWASLASPVPGNVFACMDELGLRQMRQIDDEIMAMCPMHEARTGKPDNHPSFSVHAEEGYFNCFSCGYKGPFVRMVKDILEVEWADAVLWVRARGSIDRVKRKLGMGYVDSIQSGPVDTSLQYNEASLALFVDPPQWALDKRNISLEAAQFYGVRWDPKNDAWITPIRDPSGKMMGWQEKNERYFRNKPRDVAKSSTLFGLDVFEPGTRMVIVESPLDAPRLYTAGVDGGVAAFGSGISQNQIDLAIEFAGSVVFALDADRAGDKQHEYLRNYFMRRGFPCKFMNYSHVPADVTDVGEMTDEEILYGLETASRGVVARFM